MTTHELAAGLEQLAAELRTRPDMETPFTLYASKGIKPYTTILQPVWTREEFVQFAKLGSVTKEYLGNELNLIFGKGPVRLRVFGPRNKACRIVEPAREAVYECEPLLTPDEENALAEGR